MPQHRRLQGRVGSARSPPTIMPTRRQLDLPWLATEQEKVAHYTARGIRREDLPGRLYGGGVKRTRRYFTLKLPIAADEKSATFVYVAERGRDRELLDDLLAANRGGVREAEPVTAIEAEGDHVARSHRMAAHRLVRRLVDAGLASERLPDGTSLKLSLWRRLAGPFGGVRTR